MAKYDHGGGCACGLYKTCEPGCEYFKPENIRTRSRTHYLTPPPPPKRGILIALTSPAPQSGKSTVANRLIMQHRFRLLKFAGPLKNMIRTLLWDCGIATDMTERYVDGDLKEAVIPELGVTSRKLQQDLGTGWGRELIRQDLWVHIVKKSAERLMARGQNVVIDDMRFQNEFDMVLEIFGHPIRIENSRVSYTGNHVSEGALDKVNMRVLKNDTSIVDLHLAVDDLIRQLSRP